LLALWLQITAAAVAGAKLARIDETHANPKAKFQSLGEPQYPTAAELTLLETASTVLWVPLKGEAQFAAGSLTLTVPANGLAVIDLAL
jgi:hypothetical protein